MRSSSFPQAEIHYTEWNVSPIHNDRYGKDSEFTAAFVLQTIKDIGDLADRYLFWAISDVFEESGPGDEPFSGKYGLLNIHGIKKPVFHAFRFFSQLYDEAYQAGESIFATRSGDGSLRLLTWNLNEPSTVDFSGGDYQFEAVDKTETLHITPLTGRFRVRGWRVDHESGNAYREWQEMGCPKYLTAKQIEQLKEQAEPVLFTDYIADRISMLELSHTLPPNGLIFYDIEKL